MSAVAVSLADLPCARPRRCRALDHSQARRFAAVEFEGSVMFHCVEKPGPGQKWHQLQQRRSTPPPLAGADAPGTECQAMGGESTGTRGCLGWGRSSAAGYMSKNRFGTGEQGRRGGRDGVSRGREGRRGGEAPGSRRLLLQGRWGRCRPMATKKGCALPLASRRRCCVRLRVSTSPKLCFDSSSCRAEVKAQQGETGACRASEGGGVQAPRTMHQRPHCS